MTRSTRILAWIALLLVVAGTAAWLFRDRVAEWTGGAVDRPPPPGEVSAELARYAEARLRAFAAGEEGDSLVLGSSAVQSLLHHRGDGFLPAGVEEPEVAFTDSTAVLGATIHVRELATAEAAERLRRLLGDTADVRAEVVPDLVRPATARVRVRALEAGGVTVPDLFIPMVLRQTGVPMEDAHPRSVVFGVPGALIGIAVRDSQLVLHRSAESGRGR